MIELAVSDLLRKTQLPELSYYQAGGGPTPVGSSQRDRKWSAASAETGVPREEQSCSIDSLKGEQQQPGSPDFRDQSHFSPEREESGTSLLVTAPMGSLYEVTQLGNSRENSPSHQHAPDRTLTTDFISRGCGRSNGGGGVFDYFDRRLNRYLWDGIAMMHKDL